MECLGLALAIFENNVHNYGLGSDCCYINRSQRNLRKQGERCLDLKVTGNESAQIGKE